MWPRSRQHRASAARKRIPGETNARVLNRFMGLKARPEATYWYARLRSYRNPLTLRIACCFSPSRRCHHKGPCGGTFRHANYLHNIETKP
jgi:hypothetical protein